MLSITVVIATHRRPDLLERTLESLAVADAPSARWDVIVVENGPAAGAEDVVRRFRSRLSIRYRYLAEASKARALNLALDESEGELIVFADDDVRVGARWLTAYEDAALRLGQGHFFGGPNEPDYEHRPPDWLIAKMPPCAGGLRLGDTPGYLVWHQRVLGANWAAWRSDLLQVGRFDPALGPGPDDPLVDEETAVQERMTHGGVRGYWVPQALLHHWVPASRCTERWVLRRKVRHAKTRAWRVEPPIAGPRVLGAPRWLYRELAGAAATWIGLTLARAPGAARFAAALRAAEAWGLLRGVYRRGRTGRAQWARVWLAQLVSPLMMPFE
jgi:hypothetical protein